MNELDPKKSGVQPRQLKAWAADAAGLHVNRGVPLTEAVIDVLQDKAGLTVSHIKRVCEEANVKAFRILFNKAGPNRSVQFDGGPADPVAVVAELKDGYAAAPVQEEAMKTAASKFEDLLFPGGLEKTAAGQPPREPGLSDVLAARDAVDRTGRNQIACKHRFYDQVAKLASVVRAARARNYNDDVLLGVIKEAAAGATEEFFAAMVLDRLAATLGMDKQASVSDVTQALNPDHPLVKTAQQAARVARDYAVATRAASIAEREYENLMIRGLK